MAVRRPDGPLPLGNARPGFRRRLRRFPGAGQRAPQSEVGLGVPAGALPTQIGNTGLKPFKGGRTAAGRAFQKLTDRRVSPFFVGVPTSFERPDEPGFAPQTSNVDTPAADVALQQVGGGGGGPGVVRRGSAAFKTAVLRLKQSRGQA